MTVWLQAPAPDGPTPFPWAKPGYATAFDIELAQSIASR